MNTFISNIVDILPTIDQKKLNKLKKIVLNTKGNILIMGNGGSNAISSHIAEDYSKQLKKPSLSFSDGARLTCYSNDYGYENAFLEFLKDFSTHNCLIILISSSGNSINIIKCAEYCEKNNIKFIILSGFNETNKLRQYKNKAELEFWINSMDYGIVECSHEIILHSII